MSLDRSYAPEKQRSAPRGVVRKLMGDLGAKGDVVPEQAIRAKMHDFTAQVLTEVKAGK